MIEIPINYEKGEENSNESSTCYDPDGKASTTENLFISSEYVGSGSSDWKYKGRTCGGAPFALLTEEL